MFDDEVKARNYSLTGKRDKAIRLGCEEGLYEFLNDYANDMGMSLSAALRRLALLGAHCEAQHGKVRMPTSYNNIVSFLTPVKPGSYSTATVATSESVDWDD